MKAWKAAVYINGRDIGIIEIDREFAEKYWANMERIFKYKLELRVI
jgi:hypothetical protein